MLRNKVEKIGSLIDEKFDVVELPKKDDECVTIRELIIGKSYNVEVAVGRCWRYPSYFDIVGYVWEEVRNEFIDSSIRIETKNRPRSTHIKCGVAKEGFIRSIDEARWDEKFKTLDDLIEILEKL